MYRPLAELHNLSVKQALATITSIPEGQWFERKSGRISPKDLAIPLVALANAEGGTVVVGAHDGEIDGVEASAVNEIRQAANDYTQPPVTVQIDELPAPGGRSVLILNVETSAQLHATTKGDAYVRVGDESRKLTFAQRRQLEYDRGFVVFSSTPVDAQLSDLDAKLCDEYRQAIGSASIEGMLRARDLLTLDGRITVAAWLLFARRPQTLFPSATIRVLQYADTDRGLGTRMNLMAGRDTRFDGPVAQQITDAVATVRQWMPKLQRLGPDTTFVDQSIIPEEVWKEGLINAVLHRSYANQGDHIRFEIFPDRVEITNPGAFPGAADLTNPASIIRHARNPRMARVLTELGIARELGEGIQRMCEEMRLHDLTPPAYSQTPSSVRLILSDMRATPSHIAAQLLPSARSVLDILRRTGQPASTGHLVQASGYTRPTVIRNLNSLRNAGLVVRSEGAAKDPSVTWTAVNQPLVTRVAPSFVARV